MVDDFYRNFENEFRGSPDLIRSRLEVYVQFLEPLIQHYPNGGLVDLGCGRGEWLQLTSELGFSSIGVDADDGMLEECRIKGLNVVLGDAIEFLSELDDDSQAVVSGFHIVEHIPFDVLRRLVDEALRVLKPGGLLVLETPNPENPGVANVTFYLDPTHIKPIPPALLAFILEDTGFERIKTLRLNERKQFSSDLIVELRDVFHSVSPDYAVIGLKAGTKLSPKTNTQYWESEFGVSLDEIINIWDRQFSAYNSNVNQARIAAEKSEVIANQAKLYAEKSEVIANQAKLYAEEVFRIATEAQLSLEKIYQSTSWRITAPIRLIGLILRRFLSLFLYRKSR
jgi:O-antigen chain-terminating methyltransferase